VFHVLKAPESAVSRLLEVEPVYEFVPVDEFGALRINLLIKFLLNFVFEVDLYTHR
jgi:hypothetical protein